MSGFLGTGLQIAGISLTHFELPDELPWGTKQELKEFVYPGGQNFLQPLGPTRKAMEWQGQMFGPTATDRARGLDALASSGAVQTMTFGSMSYTGVVDEFEQIYKHEWQGKYRIRIRILSDYPPPQAQDSAAGNATNDLNSASTGLSAGASGISGLAAQVQGGIGALVNSAASVVNTATGAVQGALATAQDMVGQVNAAISSVGSAISAVEGLSSGLPTPGAIAAAQGAISGTQAAIGAAAQAAGLVLSGVQATPATLLTIATAAGASANAAAAWGFVVRAGLNAAQIPGAAPAVPSSQGVPDLSNYAGA